MVSVSRLCFLPGGLLLWCANAGLFPCLSANCLSGETGVKKITFINDDNTIARPEGCGEKLERKCQEMRLIFTLATSELKGIFSCNFFLSIARVHGAPFLKTVKLWVVFLTPTAEGKVRKADGLEFKEHSDPNWDPRSHSMGQMLAGP